MKRENKKTIWKIAKILWLILGILIVASVTIWFALLPFSSNLGEMILFTAFFVYSLYVLGAYIIITFLYFVIKLITKLVKKKKKRK